LLEFGEQRQRHRRQAGDLIQEYAQAAHGMIDKVDDGRNGGGELSTGPVPLDRR
jgi:hypothetical protein